MKKITIAIDGFSSTGKSTIAKYIAKELGYVYVDSGAMYRAVTFFAMEHDFISKDHFNINGFVAALPHIELKFVFGKENDFAEMHLNGRNVEKEIRTLKVSSFVSKISALPEVRYQLVKLQREIGKNKGVVMDGRDIGTVVFPEAELKIFMTASDDIRAERRYEEIKNKGENVSFEEVLRNVRERDYIDSNRKDSPLKQAENAIVIDNSHLTTKEQNAKVMQLVRLALKEDAS